MCRRETMRKRCRTHVFLRDATSGKSSCGRRRAVSPRKDAQCGPTEPAPPLPRRAIPVRATSGTGGVEWRARWGRVCLEEGGLEVDDHALEVLVGHEGRRGGLVGVGSEDTGQSLSGACARAGRCRAGGARRCRWSGGRPAGARAGVGMPERRRFWWFGCKIGGSCSCF